jgi:hypothetical protein
MTSSPTSGPPPARPSLPESFTGDAHEPDREALASLATGRPDRRSDADWVADAARAAAVVDLDATREFWGEAPGWRRGDEVERMPRRSGQRRSEQQRSTADGLPSQRRRRAPLRRTTGSSVAVAGTRSHRVVEPDITADHHGRVPGPPPSPDRPPPSSSPTTSTSSSWGTSGPGGVDPLLFRLGVIVMIGVLLVPVMLGLRSGSNDRNAGLRTLAAGEMADMLPLRPTGRAVPVGAAPDVADVADVTEVGVDGTENVDVVAAAPAEPAAAVSCGLAYTVVAGDYWLRLADESGAELAAVLHANSATVDTPLFPGDEICLPEGATRPAPPTTAPPVSTQASPSPDVVASASSSSSATASAAAPSTAPPATTTPTTAPPTTAPSSTAPAVSPPTPAPPATTAPAVPAASNPSPQQVHQIIREVFPEGEHEMAITVASRESSFRANAYNGSCCYGIFQIHFQAHRTWLQGLGITSASQLYDARTNVELAYRIFQRSGGWGPWSQTAY